MCSAQPARRPGPHAAPPLAPPRTPPFGGRGSPNPLSPPPGGRCGGPAGTGGCPPGEPGLGGVPLSPPREAQSYALGGGEAWGRGSPACPRRVWGAAAEGELRVAAGGCGAGEGAEAGGAPRGARGGGGDTRAVILQRAPWPPGARPAAPAATHTRDAVPAAGGRLVAAAGRGWAGAGGRGSRAGVPPPGGSARGAGVLRRLRGRARRRVQWRARGVGGGGLSWVSARWLLKGGR